MHDGNYVCRKTLGRALFAILLGFNVAIAAAENVPKSGVLLSAEELQAVRVAYSELERELASGKQPGQFLGDPANPALYDAEITRTPTGFRVSFTPPLSESDARGGNWEVFVKLPRFDVDRTVFTK